MRTGNLLVFIFFVFKQMIFKKSYIPKMSAFGNGVGGMANSPFCLRVQNCPSPWRLGGFWSFAQIQAQSILPAVAPRLARKSGLEQPSQETPGPMKPEITHWTSLQEWLPGFRKNPKGEENLWKEKKEKRNIRSFFFFSSPVGTILFFWYRHFSLITLAYSNFHRATWSCLRGT